MSSNQKFISIKISVLWIFLSCALGANASLANKPLPLILGGRVLINDENHYVYSWPGVYFEAGFYGNSVDVHLNDSINILNIIVDNNAPIVLTKPGKLKYSISNLGEGAHKIRLEKRTETFSGTATFEGFYIPESQKEITLEQPKRKIEFIGDSFTVGYGNTSKKRKCNKKQVFSTTNTQEAFGSLVAKHFSAQYQINAFSGQGVVRNYNGINPETSMTAKYPYVFNHGNVIDKTDWSPQVVLVILGANDFSTPLGKNEKWKSRESLQDDFVITYEKFVLSLRTKYPTAAIILASPDAPGSEVAIQISRVVENLQAKGEEVIFFQSSDVSLALTGCDWHASVEDHQKVARMFIEYFEKNPSLWER